MADMGSLQLPKDHAGYGSQADSGLPLAGYFFSASALVIAVAVITAWLVRESTAYPRVRALRVQSVVPSTNNAVTTADRIFREFAFIFVS